MYPLPTSNASTSTITGRWGTHPRPSPTTPTPSSGFHKFLDATSTPTTSASLATVTMSTYAGWLRETPTSGFRGTTTRLPRL